MLLRCITPIVVQFRGRKASDIFSNFWFSSYGDLLCDILWRRTSSLFNTDAVRTVVVLQWIYLLKKLRVFKKNFLQTSTQTLSIVK